MSHDIELFKDLWLACCAQAWRLRRNNGKDYFYHEAEKQFVGTLPPQQKDVLEQALPRNNERKEGNFPQTLYLQPLEKENALPVVRCRWNFLEESEPTLALRIVLLKWHTSEKRWSGIGFRIDSPDPPKEGAKEEYRNNKTQHSYWHIQWITEIELSQQSISKICGRKGLPPWLPDSRPAIPIPAEDPTDAAIIAIASLYGLEHLQQMMNSLKVGQRKVLENRLRRMRLRP